MSTVDKFIKELETDLQKSRPKILEKDTGEVKEIKDEIVFLTGLDNVSFGELIEFKNGIKGLVVDLQEEVVGTIIFGDFLKIKEGDMASASGRIFEVPVASEYLGRVVDGLLNPIDGAGAIKASKYYPVERIAPGVVERQPVDRALQTGIKAVDAVVPIGRGQRELIIGDRGTGKTTIALDTIINQKGEGVICIYNCIGQKRSNLASFVELLRERGALPYTIVVAATSSDSASMQYIAPYTATCLAEFFMHKGKDVLIIYDDLTKHAWAYRQVSLVLRRPSGREAYPGDIFYLHSRLLERSCRLNKENGGGSITALPIIETQEGDVSAYIPTNVISITDGQLILETELFNAGMRPAINIGSSVSRVGGAAQTRAMKKVAGKLKFDLAQYRELAAFSQFAGDVDGPTKKFLDRGVRMTELLKQNKNNPLDLSSQVVSLYAAVNGFLDNISKDKINEFESKLLSLLNLKNKKLMERINNQKTLEEKDEKEIKAAIVEIIELNYSVS